MRSAHGAELGRGHSGDKLELIGEMLNTAVSEFVRDLAERQIPILQKFLGVLDALENEVPLDGQVLNG